MKHLVFMPQIFEANFSRMYLRYRITCTSILHVYVGILYIKLFYLQPAQAQVTVVTSQPVVVQKPVFRDYPVVVTLENGQQVLALTCLYKLFVDNADVWLCYHE